MDGGAWRAAVHGVARGRTRLSDFAFTFHFHALEKEMATHSSVLAWRIPGTAEPGVLPFLGSRRVGHDWGDLAAAARSPLSQVPHLALPSHSLWSNASCSPPHPNQKHSTSLSQRTAPPSSRRQGCPALTHVNLRSCSRTAFVP